MNIAKHMAEKRLAAAKKLALVKSQKRKMTVSFDSNDQHGGKRIVHAEIELQVK